MNCLGNWRAEQCWLQSPPLSCYMTGVLEIFLQRPTIALLLQRISHVAHVYIYISSPMPLFILLLKIAFVELMVGEMEACTCVTYIAKPNKGSMEMTNQTSWSRSCTYVEGGWWMVEWNTPFMNLSLSFIWISWGHGYKDIFFFSFFSFFHGHRCVHFFLGHASWACHLFFFFFSFFFFE